MKQTQKPARTLLALIAGTCLLAGMSPAIADQGQQNGWNANDRQTAASDRRIIVNQGPIIVIPQQQPTAAPAPAPAPVHVPAPAAVPTQDRYLPLACVDGIELGDEDLYVFDSACMRNRGISLRDLPAQCAVSIRISGDSARGYNPVCLRQAGYRLAGD